MFCIILFDVYVVLYMLAWNKARQEGLLQIGSTVYRACKLHFVILVYVEIFTYSEKPFHQFSKKIITTVWLCSVWNECVYYTFLLTGMDLGVVGLYWPKTSPYFAYVMFPMYRWWNCWSMIKGPQHQGIPYKGLVLYSCLWREGPGPLQLIHLWCFSPMASCSCSPTPFQIIKPWICSWQILEASEHMFCSLFAIINLEVSLPDRKYQVSIITKYPFIYKCCLIILCRTIITCKGMAVRKV